MRLPFLTVVGCEYRRTGLWFSVIGGCHGRVRVGRVVTVFARVGHLGK